MSWHRLSLSSTEVAAGTLQQRREEFIAVFADARGPRTMALFQQERPDGGLDLFLTPGCCEFAAELLERWRCCACDRPSMIGLFLAAGHNEMTYYMP